MSVLVVANADRPLTRICQVVGHFLAYRGRQAPNREAEALLGIWRDPAPLATVTALGQATLSHGATEPLVHESFGHEDEWYVCWLATDLGPQGEIETLGGLVNLLLEERKEQDADPAGSLSPCFAHTTPDQDIRAQLERLGTRFPNLLSRAVTQEPATGRLLPQPDLPAVPNG
ncbi:hypothetical protein [Thiohalorhabdus sp.]|uniref:hypothetical protein n=1 Tax=Thiohalorhabdus sp. TaxID=3094134 RepID=UPI002FC2EF64